jgi:hypothetical protein
MRKTLGKLIMGKRVQIMSLRQNTKYNIHDYTVRDLSDPNHGQIFRGILPPSTLQTF